MKVILDKGQTLEEAEQLLLKSIKKKTECTGKEVYSDSMLNEFHDQICEKHRKLLNKIEKEITQEIERNVANRRHL